MSFRHVLLAEDLGLHPPSIHTGVTPPPPPHLVVAVEDAVHRRRPNVTRLESSVYRRRVLVARDRRQSGESERRRKQISNVRRSACYRQVT